MLSVFLLLYSAEGFRPSWTHLWTPLISFQRCSAPLKLPSNWCLPYLDEIRRVL